MHIMHLDGNKENNHENNLEQGTPRENRLMIKYHKEHGDCPRGHFKSRAVKTESKPRIKSKRANIEPPAWCNARQRAYYA